MINKILQGDCLEVMKQIPDNSIGMIITYPPYGMSFQSNYRKEKYSKITGDSTIEWVDDFAKESHRVA